MNENIVLIFFLLIVISIITVLIREFGTWAYTSIFIIVVSFLLLYPQILSPYVVGIDAHYEHIIAEFTLIHGYWNPNYGQNIVNAALSITILVPILSLISNLSLDYILKFILCVFPLSSILLIWKLNKKMFRYSNRESFLSLLVLIGSAPFMYISVYGRQEVGLFSAIILYYIILFKVNSPKSSFIAILLYISLIFAHYSTAFLFITIYIFSLLILRILDKETKMNYVLISFVLLIFWLFDVVYISRMSFSHILENILNSIFSWSTDSTSYVVKRQLNPTFTNIFDYLNYIINISIIALLTLGTSHAVYNQIILKKSQHIQSNRYIMFAFIATLLIFVSILPGISLSYNIERIYVTTLFLCNGFVLVGLNKLYDVGTYFAKKFTKHGSFQNDYKSFFVVSFASILFISHFLLQIGLPSELVYKNSDSKYFGDFKQDMHYTLNEEISAIEWIKHNMNEKSILLTDFYGRGRLPLQTYGGFNESNYRDVKDNRLIGISSFYHYFYQQKFFLAKNNMVFSQDMDQIIEINNYLQNQTSIIYDSGNSSIYYK